MSGIPTPVRDQAKEQRNGDVGQPPHRKSRRGLRRSNAAAKFCGVSRTTLHRWVVAGLCPPPRKVGRSRLWSIKVLRAWIEAGLPPAAEFEKLQKVGQ